jgi:choline kinase
MPLTAEKPKCMVEYKNSAIIDYIIQVSEKCSIDKNVVVTGYCDRTLKKHLENHTIAYYHNNKFDCTNMVYSFFCAEPEFDDDIIVSYSDIIYSEKILKKLIDSENEISVVVDKKWKELWEQRFDDPLQDAETMKIGKNGNILELGKKTQRYDEIEGQYIGLIKFSANAINKIKSFYHSLDKAAIYDTKNFENMYMTSFIQLIIDNKIADVRPVFIEGGWVEIDSSSDLAVEMV